MAIIRVKLVVSEDNTQEAKDKYHSYLKKEQALAERRQARVRKHRARSQ